ncbi:hypothetical protein D3C80_1573080 [compost metagenome]
MMESIGVGDKFNGDRISTSSPPIDSLPHKSTNDGDIGGKNMDCLLLLLLLPFDDISSSPSPPLPPSATAN